MKHVFTLFLLACFFVSKSQLKITDGTRLINSGRVVLYNTGIDNKGIFSNKNNAVVVIRGNKSISISGTGATNFYTLELDKSSGPVTLQKNISVKGPLKFTKGSVDLTDYNIELIYPDGLLVNESEQNRIYTLGTGEVFITQTLSAPNNSNPGNIGVSITSQNNLGVTTIRRGHKIQTNNAQQQSIHRYFQIEPANNSGIQAALRFTYFDAELNNLPETNYSLFEKAGSSDWKALPADGISMLYNYREKFGLTSLNRYTMFSSIQGSLPLTLLAFHVSCKGGDASLQWITANEVNTKQFTIEKSTDGTHWQATSIVPSKGNTAQHTYSATVLTGDAFLFRLKMEDVDGKFTYSPVKKVDCSDAQKIIVGPNPTKGNVTISATVNKEKILMIHVIDLSGRTILTKQWQTKQGLNSDFIDLYKHPSSTYLVIVKGEDVNETIKLVKH